MPKKRTPYPIPPFAGLTNDQTSFLIASSDFELLNQVSQLMNRQGVLSMMDTAGRVQYLVDGRKGSPLAARRIMDTTRRLMRDRYMDQDEMKPIQALAVDEVLRRWRLSAKLNGYRYLRTLLLLAAGNDTALRPIGKTLYPAIAQEYNVTYSRIERNIRYCLASREGRHPHISNTEAICSMSDEVAELAARLVQQTKLPIVADATTGSFYQV